MIYFDVLAIRPILRKGRASARKVFLSGSKGSVRYPSYPTRAILPGLDGWKEESEQGRERDQGKAENGNGNQKEAEKQGPGRKERKPEGKGAGPREARNESQKAGDKNDHPTFELHIFTTHGPGWPEPPTPAWTEERDNP